MLRSYCVCVLTTISAAPVRLVVSPVPMRNYKIIMRVGYGVLLVLVAFVFYLVYDSTHHENSEVIRLFSAHEVSVVRLACICLGTCAGGVALFLVVRAFYFAFTKPQLGKKDDYVG